MIKKYGFTLAEVLITLGIIGIVAAMTIPTLIANQQDQAIVSQLKKDFSLLSSAFLNIKSENGELQDWCTGSQLATQTDTAKCVGDLFASKLKVIKNCGNSLTDCNPTDGYKYLNDETSFDVSFTYTWRYKMILADGSSLFINAMQNASGVYEMDIYADVNGPKKPNRLGIDLFPFAVFATNYDPTNTPLNRPRTIAPLSIVKNGDLYPYCNRVGGGGSYKYGQCTAWVIYNGNLDYKYVDDLNWTTKTHK